LQIQRGVRLRGSRADRQVRIPPWKRLQSLCPGHRGEVEPRRLLDIVEPGAAAVEFGKSIECHSGHERSVAIRIGDGAPVHAGRRRFRRCCAGQPEKKANQEEMPPAELGLIAEREFPHPGLLVIMEDIFSHHRHYVP
jgi:hypothetical protein